MNTFPPLTPHLLVVDENFANRMLPGLFLREYGWQVSECASAEEAGRIIDGGLITHVLLDTSLPRVGDLQFCQQLRLSPMPSRLYLYAYTAHAMQNEWDKFVRAGFDGILVKPICMNDLTSLFGLTPPT